MLNKDQILEALSLLKVVLRTRIQKDALLRATSFQISSLDPIGSLNLDVHIEVAEADIETVRAIAVAAIANQLAIAEASLNALGVTAD